ncbi:hypothetical protein [Paenibacillus sp. MBLB4367]|uniref:hypothetical protein n=1 Tax=Paenibacillus sp. MBLB4367 TaxID=3384767 RepID=UPI0039082664
MELSIDVVLFLVCALSCCAWIAGPKAVRIRGIDMSAVMCLLPLRANKNAARRRLPIKLLTARRKLPQAFREAARGDEPASGMENAYLEHPSKIPGGIMYDFIYAARAAADRRCSPFAAHAFVSPIA